MNETILELASVRPGHPSLQLGQSQHDAARASLVGIDDLPAICHWNVVEVVWPQLKLR